MAIKRHEVILWTILALLLWIIGVNFDDKIQSIMVMALVIILFLKIFDLSKGTSFPIERTRNLSRTFMLTVIGLISTYLITLLVFWTDKNFFGGSFFGTQSITLQSIFNYFAQQNLIFTGSIFLTFVAIAGIVAISETWVLVTLMDFVADIFKVDFNLWKAKTYAVLAVLVGFITILHFNAKGLNAAALVPVVVFFFVSLVIAIIEKQGLAAILMHVINNAIALFISYGLISSINLTGPVMVVVISMIVIWGLFKTKILVKPLSG